MAIWSILWPFGLFYGHLVYFMAIWSILWPFGIFYAHLIYFWKFGIVSPFAYVVPRQSGNPVMQPCSFSVGPSNERWMYAETMSKTKHFHKFGGNFYKYNYNLLT
jgi:hypothetical protein